MIRSRSVLNLGKSIRALVHGNVLSRLTRPCGSDADASAACFNGGRPGQAAITSSTAGNRGRHSGKGRNPAVRRTSGRTLGPGLRRGDDRVVAPAWTKALDAGIAGGG